MICRKTMSECQTPGMCAPYGGCGPEMKHVYTLQDGEQYKFWNGCIIVAHPDRPPKIVHSDGTTEIIAPHFRSP